VFVQDDEVLDRVAHLGHMADEDDEASIVLGDQSPDPVHGKVQMLGVEAAESLIEEEGVETPAAPRDHLRQRERERQRGQERLAAGERIGLAHLPGRVQVLNGEAPIVGEPVRAVGQLFEVLAAEVGQLGALLL
jgi:hypothetical protein